MANTFHFCSFDIYDTLLTRAWANQQGLYYQVAIRLATTGLISVAPEDWATKRIAVEQDLWKKSYRTHAVKLADIYAELSSRYGWDSDGMKAAMQIEVSEELQSLHPIASNLAVLNTERLSGKQIAFVSDMHMPGEAIGAALGRAGLMRSGDLLLVSADVNKTKAGRTLFRYLLKLSKVAPKHHIHYGDNLGSDVRAANKTGIRGQHLTAGHLSKYEHAISSDQRLDGRFRSLLAGTMRIIRVQHSCSSNQEKTIWNVGADVIGPVIYAYVRWVIGRAHQLGIQRLYFLARDGQLPLEIARVILSGSDIPEVKYLYASRQAWHLPALSGDLTEVDLGWILDAGSAGGVSLSDIAKRLELEVTDLQIAFVSPSLKKIGFADRLGSAHLSSLRNELIGNPAIACLIRSAADRAQSVLREYLRQEGLFDGVPSAVVDTGWNGRLQRSLGKVLRSQSTGLSAAHKTHGFYFGLKNRLMAEGFDNAEAFIVDCVPGRNNDLCHAPIIELFTEATHGTTTGYKVGGDGGCHPVLKEAVNSKAIEWGLVIQQRAAVEFCKKWVALSREYAIDANDGEWKIIAEKLLDRFVFNPDLDEASVFGCFPKTSSQSHDDPNELSLPIPRLTALRYLLIGGRGVVTNKVRLLTWINGSFMRSGYPWLSKCYSFKKRVQWWIRR